MPDAFANRCHTQARVLGSQAASARLVRGASRIDNGQLLLEWPGQLIRNLAAQIALFGQECLAVKTYKRRQTPPL